MCHNYLSCLSKLLICSINFLLFFSSILLLFKCSMDLPICFTLNCASMLLICSFENETRVTNLAVELELLVSVLRLESFESFCSFMLKWILLLHFLLEIFYEVLRDVRTHLSILYLHHILWLILFILNSLLLFHSFSISLRQMFMTLFARLLSIFWRICFT